MSTNTPWVALLDEDEDDLIFWKYGFDSWADHLQLQCFTSVNEFWRNWSKSAQKPTLIIIAELSPSGDEKDRLLAFLNHECCQQSKVFLVTDLIQEDEYESYRELGAADCFHCPTNTNELQRHIAAFNQYAALA
jgi:hypothetical protein